MGLKGALWKDEDVDDTRVVWPRKPEPSHGSSSASNTGGGRGSDAVSTARGSVPGTAGAGGGCGSVSTPREALTVVGAGGSVPVRTAVLTVKRGKVVIRSAAVHRTNGNCDVFVDLTLMDRRLFTTTEEDGRNAATQEQIMSHEMLTLVLNCKNVIRHRLADMRQDPCVRVVIQSHCGKHRSVAMAEFLAKACEAFADVTLFHMEVHRWDSNYAEAPRDELPAPKHSLVIRPGSTGNV